MNNKIININGYIIKCLQCNLMSAYRTDRADGKDAQHVEATLYHMEKCYIGIDLGSEQDETVYYADGKTV